MMNEKVWNDAVRDALKAVGFRVIRTDMRVPSRTKVLRPDFVALAADESGELVPWAVVEVISPTKAPHDLLALQLLSRYRDQLATRDHYVVQAGQWLKADDGLQKLNPVDGPTPPNFGGAGRVEDVSLVEELLAAEVVAESGDLWAARREDVPHVDIRWDGPKPVLNGIEVNPEVLWRARRRAMDRAAAGNRRKGTEDATTPATVRTAMAHLVGAKLTHDVFDPFCGVGGSLWEAVDYAKDHGLGLSAGLGMDINQDAVRVARELADLSPVNVEIQQANVFDLEDLPMSSVIISSPPMNVRLARAWQLQTGMQTTDGTAAAVDLAVRLLAPGGRAVLQLAPNFVLSHRHAALRDLLANQYWVSALIGLPSGSVAGTMVGSVLLVIDNAEPRPTFVAQLGEDWEARLTPGGSALREAVAFMEEDSDRP